VEGFVDVSMVLKAGVYALLSRGTVVYIGKSKCMLGRVYSHRNRYVQKRKGRAEVPWWLESAIPAISFDQILVFPCAIEHLDRLERHMIDKYRPRYNQHLKPPGRAETLVLAGIEMTTRPRAPELVTRR